MKQRNTVSGHSGLPEDVELQQMADKAKAQKEKRQKQYESVLECINKQGIAPSERRRFIIGFAQWVETK